METFRSLRTGEPIRVPRDCSVAADHNTKSRPGPTRTASQKETYTVNKRIIAATAAAAAVVVGAGIAAQPATAATTQDTTVTAAVAAGDLSISAPTALDLGAITPGSAGTATLSGIQVTDARAGTAGWVASATATDVTSAALGTTISASNIAVTTANAAVTGTATVAASNTVGGAANAAVQTASGVSGNNTATWDETISLTVPGDALAAGDYTTTITHSVL